MIKGVTNALAIGLVGSLSLTGTQACRSAQPAAAPVSSPSPRVEPLEIQGTGATLVPEGAYGAGAYQLGRGPLEPKLLKYVEAVYPSSARDARIQGTVILEAIIGKDGAIRDVRLVRALEPSLDQAAMDAFKQRRYQPVVFGGVPVEVIVTATTRFALR